LIEKMVALMKEELTNIIKTKEADPAFIYVAVDFLRTYADQCHHGKEEDILFRDLKKKQLSPEHKKIIENLIADHVFARKTVGELLDANNSDNVDKILESLKKLVELYPRHIKIEDKDLFLPCMKYFSKEEQDAMVQEFWTFDKMMIHKKYEQVVEKLGMGGG